MTLHYQFLLVVDDLMCDPDYVSTKKNETIYDVEKIIVSAIEIMDTVIGNAGDLLADRESWPWLVAQEYVANFAPKQIEDFVLKLGEDKAAREAAAIEAAAIARVRTAKVVTPKKARKKAA